MPGLPKAIEEAIRRLGALSAVSVERTHEGGGRMTLRGEGSEEERIAFNLSDAEVYMESYRQMREALREDTTLLPEEVDERVDVQGHHGYGSVMEAARRKWPNKN